jgi:large subunit ribosomal protein L15
MERHTMTRPLGLKRARRIGRGSKRGKTSGRGTKGQKARAGNKRRPEMRDIIKKIPKRRGYGKNRARGVVPGGRTNVVNLRALNMFEDGVTVDVGAIMKAGLVRRVDGKVPPIKILGGGDLSKKLIISGIPVSVSAKAAIEKAGGSVKI